MFPTYDYSEIRYRPKLDPNHKEKKDQEEEEDADKKDGEKGQQAKKFTSEKDEEENQAKQKLERRKKEIKTIVDFMRFMQNNIADRKTQNYVFQVEEKVLVDDFLNKHEFEEMQRNYNDFNLGDLVLIFFNPDREDKEKCFGKTPYTKFVEAESVYDNFLKVLSENGQSPAQLVQERKAFLYSYLMLDDYIEKVDPQKQKQKEQEIEMKRRKQVQKVEKMKEKNRKNQKNNLDPQNEQDKSLNDEEKQIGNKKEKKRDKTKWDLFLEEFQKLKLARLNQEGEFNGFNLIEEQYLNDLLMEVPLNEKIQFKDVKKKLYGGGFLTKYSDDPLYQTEWLCSNDQPRDFLTLVRFTIQSKLTRNSNFHTRCFISEFGEDIFMVLKGNEKDFDKEAKESQITKQLELGYSDLFSLEPCDIRYRPLRLKKQIQSCVNEIMKDKHFAMKDEEPTIKKAQTLRNFRRIEDRTKMLFDVVKKWNNDLFWTNLALKQIKVNKFMDNLSEKLGINRDNEKAEILDDDDENTSREEWEAYYVYLDYLMYFQKKMLELHQIAKNDQKEKLLRKYDLITQNEAFLYKLIFRKALGDTNEVFHLINGSLSKTKILQNIWDRLDTRPISAFVDYFETSNEKVQFIWRRYEVNEKKNRSKYLNMERIKLTYSMVVNQINLEGLSKSKLYLRTFMAIHDPYQLKGNEKAPMFKKLVEANIVDDDIVTETEKELRKFFKLLEDEAEGADFDAECVAEENKLDIKKPWEVQIDSLRDYFGEKLALYFKFVQFFTFHLSYLAFIGIIIQILKVIIISDIVEFYLNTIFASFIILWSTLFVEFWKRQQILFTIEFGQQKFEEDEAERPEFIGVYQRSIENDKINEKYFSPVKRRMIMLAGMVGSFFIIFLVVLTMYNIFNLRQEWTTNPPPIIGSNAVLATNVMNSLQIVVFTQIYNVFANFLNKIENHKILSSYENSYIAKLFLFQFFNTFNSLILISFFNSIPPFSSLNLCASQVVQTTVVNGKTVKQTVPGEINCFNVLQANIITIFLTMIIKTVLEVVIPFATQNAMKLLKKQLLSRGEIHPFTKIDKEIEDQSLLNPYITNDDLDGTVQDYLQLIVKFSFLTLFGLSFPPTYAIAFGNNIIQLQVDKIKLIYLYQRPIPKGASNIGTWLVILEAISFIATFGNAGLIIYTSKYRDYLTGNEPLISFVSLLILFLSIKYFISLLVPDVPEKALIINKRNQVAVDRIIKGFKKDNSGQVTVSKVNFNIQNIKQKKAD